MTVPRWRHWRVIASAFLHHLRTKPMYRYCPAPVEPGDVLSWRFDLDDRDRCSRPIGRLRWAATGRCRKHHTT